MKLIKRLEKNYSFWFLIIISVIFFLLRLPSLFEPYWYGDEGVYQAVGMLINSGQSLYSGAWDNKPPLFLTFYAIFNSDQYVIRSISLIFGLVSTWIFYLLSTKLFPSKKYISYITTSAFVFIFGTRIIEGNIANAENFLLLPILTSAYLIYDKNLILKIKKFNIYFIAGVVIGIAFMSKIVAIFDFAAFTFFLFLISNSNIKKTIKEDLLPYIVGFLTPTILISIYFIIRANFKFFEAFLFSNINYVGYGNEFFIPQGLLILKLSILGIFSLFVFWKRKNISKNILFIIIWFAFSLFSVFFSQRPYSHYLIMLIPSFSLLIGAAIYAKKFQKIILAITLLIVYLIINNTFNLETKITDHYKNLYYFCSDKKDLANYQAFFDQGVPRDYEVARYLRLNTNKNDKVFIWGNNAQLYKMINKTPPMRYTVAYHILYFPTGVEEMKKMLNDKKPEFIVIMPNVPEIPTNLENYTEVRDISGTKIYEKIL